MTLSYTIVFLLCLTDVRGYRCTDTAEVTLSVAESPAASGCTNSTTGSYLCSDFQSALLFIVDNTTDAECRIFCVHLEPGVHVIRKPILISSSVLITSSNKTEEQTIITCKFNASEVDGNHSIYFNQSNSVTISNVTVEGCPLPLRLFEVQNVILRNAILRYFTEAVFDIHNCVNVTVNDCYFLNNYGTGIIQEPFRGNTGALAITYLNMNTSLDDPTIIVSGCTFINNSANATKNRLTTNRLFSTGIFTGRGGAMAIFVSESHFTVTARVINCNYINNYASSFGGGLYIFFSGYTFHNASVENCTYHSNMANLGGGGIISVGTRGSISMPRTLYYTSCHFENNSASVGGGVYFSVKVSEGRSNVGHFTSCMFIRNKVSNQNEGFGAALAIINAENYSNKELFPNNTITDCYFVNNIGRSSIVSIGTQNFKLLGKVQFINNNGPALRLVDSRLTVNGQVEFINNTVTEGGALYLLSFSQVRLVENTKILFEGNRGRFGASIFVLTATTSKTFQNTRYNQQCFLVLESNKTLPPSQWKQTGIDITFTKNSAWFASAVFATSLTSCSWAGGSNINTFDVTYFPQWPIFTKNDSLNTRFDHSFGTNAVELQMSLADETIAGWPGQNINVSVVATDELGNSAGTLALLEFNSSIINEMDNSRITPDAFLVSRRSFFASFIYNIKAEEMALFKANGTLATITAFNSGVVIGHKVLNSGIEHLKIETSGCIGGYSLTITNDVNSLYSCTCYHDMSKILQCENDQDSIIIKSNQWTTYSRSEDGNLFFYPCPPGYCRCFLNTSAGSSSCSNVYVNSDPDRQCVCDRKGILCGECGNGEGVSVLLNNCMCSKSSNHNIALIPLLVIIDVIVMVLIILMDVPLPEWTYSCLFYLQSVPIVSLFFPNTVTDIGKTLYYVSSALSFYFPYDFCLYEMSTLASYGLKFTPVVIAIIVVPITVYIRHLVRVKFTSLSALQYHGIWTIILLLYPHTLYTAMSILHCPSIPDNNSIGQYSKRWFYDGSVKCFRERHLLLSIFAIFTLIICVSAIPLTIVLTYRKSKKFIMLYNLSSSLKHPYNTHMWFWYAIELGQRLVLLVLVTALPHNTPYVILLLMMLFALYGYIQPYNTRSSNYLNFVANLLFMILLMLRANPYLQDHFNTIQSTSSRTILTSIPPCDSDDVVVITFSILLCIMYYLTLLIALVLLILWIGQTIWKKCFKKVIETENTSIQADDLKSDYYEYHDYLLQANQASYSELPDFSEVNEDDYII